MSARAFSRGGLMEIYWMHAAIGAMIVLGVYNVVIKKFVTSEDWRVLLPLVGVVGLLLAVYFAMSYREVKFTGMSIPYALALGTLFAISTVLTYVALKDGPISVVITILSISVVFAVLTGVLLFGEQITLARGAGIALGLASIYLLAN